MSITHIPKGGMCATCTKKHENCSALDFTKMPVFHKRPEYTIVICSFYKRELKK